MERERLYEWTLKLLIRSSSTFWTSHKYQYVSNVHIVLTYRYLFCLVMLPCCFRILIPLYKYISTTGTSVHDAIIKIYIYIFIYTSVYII